MSANKLDDNRKLVLCGWLCQGLTDSEVNEQLMQNYDLTLSYQQLSSYRTKWAEQIDEAEAHAVETAKRQGWGRRSRRVAAICKKLDKLDEALDEAALSQWGNLGREMREWMHELREELGQQSPTKHEIEANVTQHTNGNDIITELGADEEGRELLCRLAERRAAAQGDTG